MSKGYNERFITVAFMHPPCTVVTYVKEINKNFHSHHYVHMHVSDLPVPIVLRCFICHTRFQNNLENNNF